MDTLSQVETKTEAAHMVMMIRVTGKKPLVYGLLVMGRSLVVDNPMGRRGLLLAGVAGGGNAGGSCSSYDIWS